MASGTIYGTTSNQFIECAMDWESTPNIDANKSTVTVKQYYRRTNGYVTENYGYYSISINGVSNYVDAKFTTIRSDWVLVNTFTTEVAHNSDGSCSVQISCTGYIRYTTLTDTYCSGTVALDLIPRASAIDSAADIQFDQNVNVRWKPLSVNFRYKVQISFGSWSYTSPVIHPNSISEYTFSGCAIPMSTASQIPNASVGTATVRLMTYSDSGGTTQIGNTAEKTFRVTLPQNDTTRPSLSVSIAPVSSLPSSFQDLYIQEKSKLKATITASGYLGATIVSKYFTLQGTSYGENEGYTTEYLLTPGSLTLTAYALDSRGFLSQATKTFIVQPYSRPRVQNASVYRCDSNGTISDSGTYIKITATRVYASVSGRNASELYYRIRTENGSFGSLKRISASGNTVTSGALEGGTVAIENTYFVEVVAQDSIGESGSTTIMVPTAEVYEHEAGSIGSYGFGKYVTEPNTFDIDKDKILRVRGNAIVDGNLTATGFQLTEKEIYVGGDLNTYYPVHVDQTGNHNQTVPMYLFLKKNLGSTAPPWPGSHSNGSSISIAWMYRCNAWDGNGSYISTLYRDEPYGSVLSAVSPNWGAAFGVVLYLRGGGATYRLSSNMSFNPKVYLTQTDISLYGANSDYPVIVKPTTEIGNRGVFFENTSFLLDRVYPIGSIYISYSHTSPASIFGGTWTRIQDAFLWASAASAAIGARGGASTHTLTASEMPSHSHDMPFSGSSSGVQSPYKYIVLSSAASDGDGGKGYRNNMGTFAVGEGAAHNNMPPYIQVSVWRRTA